jgi:hypothetical protein
MEMRGRFERGPGKGAAADAGGREWQAKACPTTLGACWGNAL